MVHDGLREIKTEHLHKRDYDKRDIHEIIRGLMVACEYCGQEEKNAIKDEAYRKPRNCKVDCHIEVFFVYQVGELALGRLWLFLVYQVLYL